MAQQDTEETKDESNQSIPGVVGGMEPTVPELIKAGIFGPNDITKAAQASDIAYKQAVKNVFEMKKKYGAGISSLIIIENRSTGQLVFHTREVESGRLWAGCDYPKVINPGQNGCFLFVKSSGTATGSIGSVTYTIKGYNKEADEWVDVSGAGDNPRRARFNWSTPYAGDNSTKGTCIVHRTGEQNKNRQFEIKPHQTGGTSPLYSYDFNQNFL